jgi:hypothetical protein
MIKKFQTLINDKSDNELCDVFLNSSKYQPEFIELVEKELLKRKIPLESLKYINEKNEVVKDETLQLGKQGNQFWMIAAFILSIFGGIWPLFAGYNYAFSKHKNTKGVEYFVYNKSTRKKGEWMLIIGGTVLGGWYCILMFL